MWILAAYGQPTGGLSPDHLAWAEGRRLLGTHSILGELSKWLAMMTAP